MWEHNTGRSLFTAMKKKKQVIDAELKKLADSKKYPAGSSRK
jgi:hypothetical protein